MIKIFRLVCVTVLTVMTALTSSTVAAQSGGDTDGKDVCASIPLGSIEYLDGKGNAVGSSVSGGGTVEHFPVAPNVDVMSIKLPLAFDPAKADAATLERFRIAPPSDPAEYESWRSNILANASAKDHSPTTICLRNRTSSVKNSAWSGRLNGPSSGYTSVSGYVSVPTYVAACPQASAHSTWVGIGGIFPPAAGTIKSVAQAGFDTSQASLQGVFPFIEVSGALDQEIQVSSPSLTQNQNVYLYTHWLGLAGNGRDISFQIGSATYAMSVPTNTYDTTSAEWIDERPSGTGLSYPPIDGSYWYYRQSSTVYWSNEVANSHYAAYFASSDAYIQYGAHHVLGNASLTSVNPSNSRDYTLFCY